MNSIPEMNFVPTAEAVIAIGTYVQACMERQPIDALGRVFQRARKKLRRDARKRGESGFNWKTYLYMVPPFRRRRRLRRAILPPERASQRMPGSAELADHLSSIFDRGLGGKQVMRPTGKCCPQHNLRRRKLYFPTREELNNSDSHLSAWGFLALGTALVVCFELVAALTADRRSNEDIGWAFVGFAVLTIGLGVIEVWNSLSVRALRIAYENSIEEANLDITKILAEVDAKQNSVQPAENGNQV